MPTSRGTPESGSLVSSAPVSNSRLANTRYMSYSSKAAQIMRLGERSLSANRQQRFMSSTSSRSSASILGRKPLEWRALSMKRLAKSLSGHETDEGHVFDLFDRLARNRVHAEGFAKTEAIRLRRGGKYRLEGRDDAGIELTLYSLCEPKPRNPARHRIAVRTIRCHRVVCVSYGDD